MALLSQQAALPPPWSSPRQPPSSRLWILGPLRTNRHSPASCRPRWPLTAPCPTCPPGATTCLRGPTRPPWPTTLRGAPTPPPSGQMATVLVPSGAATTVTVLQGEIFQAAPVQTVCPHCQQAITTKTTHEIGLMNFLLGFFCCFVGCDLGCCLIPCLIDEFKDVTHTCPNCKAYIYTYKRVC
ncbi:hypothetical protein lerEdw1_004551 [Lerista edwardsae]|nr:hypothetical protein lerEdw1_004551 [Lerista edwardsae]